MFLPDEYLSVHEAAWLVARWAEQKILADRLADDGEGAASVVIAQKLAGGELAALAWVADGRFFQLPATYWRTVQAFEALDAGEISFLPDYGVPPVKLLIRQPDLTHVLGVGPVGTTASSPSRRKAAAKAATAGSGGALAGGALPRSQPEFTLHVGPGIGGVAEALLNLQLDALELPRGLPKPRPKVILATPEEVKALEARRRQRTEEFLANLPKPPFIPSGYLWIAPAIARVSGTDAASTVPLPPPDLSIPPGSSSSDMARLCKEYREHWRQAQEEARAYWNEVEQKFSSACQRLFQAFGDGDLRAYGLSEAEGSLTVFDPQRWRTSGGREALRQGFVLPPPASGDGARVWIMVREADFAAFLRRQLGDGAPTGSEETTADRWMRENVTAPGRKRDGTIKECQDKAVVKYREARDAWGRLPAELRGVRGSKK